jgi:hypothetical protein
MKNTPIPKKHERTPTTMQKTPKNTDFPPKGEEVVKTTRFSPSKSLTS